MSMFKKKLLVCILTTFLGVMLITTLLCHTCSAYVYWANVGGNTIGRANLDGTSPNQSWITGCNRSYGIAVMPDPTPPIPTLSEWGMILFGLLLLGSTIFVLRKRREV